MRRIRPPDRGDMLAGRLNNVFSPFRAANHKPAIVRLHEYIPRSHALDVINDFADRPPLPGPQPGVFASRDARLAPVFSLPRIRSMGVRHSSTP
jgi:hypothetical protein